MIETITANQEHQQPTTTAAARRRPQVAVAAPGRVQWPWGMVSMLGLTVLAVMPFVR